jgi:heptosyltransferase-3
VDYNFQSTYGNYPDLSQVKKILIIKMRHHGDVLLTSPLFQVLKTALPHASIDAYIYKETLPMLEGHPCISNFILYDRKWKSLGFPRLLLKEAGIFKQIRRNRYDMVINLTEGDRGANAARISGAPIRVGYEFANKPKRKAFTHHVKVCTTPRHTVEQHLDVARRLGITPLDEDKKLSFYIPEKAIEKMSGFLKEQGIDKYILVHPVSRWLFKCPPPQNIAKWLRKLDAEGNKLIITAGPDKQEMAMVDQILSLVPEISVCNLAGKLTLKELGALIKMSDCLLCVDSVPLHMASALQTAVTVLFGPSVDAIWGPWMNPKGKVLASGISCRPCGLDGCGGSKKSECLTHISTEVVVQAVRSCQSGAYSCSP